MNEWSQFIIVKYRSMSFPLPLSHICGTNRRNWVQKLRYWQVWLGSNQVRQGLMRTYWFLIMGQEVDCQLCTECLLCGHKRVCQPWAVNWARPRSRPLTNSETEAQESITHHLLTQQTAWCEWSNCWTLFSKPSLWIRITSCNHHALHTHSSQTTSRSHHALHAHTPKRTHR